MGTLCLGGYSSAQFKVQIIGVYDTEAGIKPRPGVTHLLNLGNVLIFCLFVLHGLTQMQN